jgi:kynurenine formamidase
MRLAHASIGSVCAALLTAGCAGNSHTPMVQQAPPRLDPAKIIDLSSSFGPETIYWPAAEPFKLQRVAYGRTPKGYWYAANNLSMAEHGGTHMDAPIHFAEGHRTSAEVPLANCIGPAVVIDISEAAARDVDYRMTIGDVEAFEKQHGRIPARAVVVLHSGWGKRWPDRKRYLGTDVPMDVKNLHFPGFSREAAERLVRERNVAALATDTASIDYGQSEDFIVHQVLNGADKPGFENVANTDRLPPTGAWFVALPLKIENGTGGPARIVGVLP